VPFRPDVNHLKLVLISAVLWALLILVIQAIRHGR
jgi:hypothetical protein